MRLRRYWPVWIPTVALAGALAYMFVEWNASGDFVSEYHVPQVPPDDALDDDRLDTKTPAFIPNLIDRRPEGGWHVNASAAVLSLDLALLKPDLDAGLLELRASYADAMAHAPDAGSVLPSVNMIDGKAKQFDDGLFAALDLAYFKGDAPSGKSFVTIVTTLHDKVGRESPASAYLAAGLKIAGVDTQTDDPARVKKWLDAFESDATAAKPFGFYTWNPELVRNFRFVRFFQQALPQDDPRLIADLVKALGADALLLDNYRAANLLLARLTNLGNRATLTDVLKNNGKPPFNREVAFFSSARSKEGELLGKVFSRGLPPTADLMRELIRTIRRGRLDLAPTADSGWYDYQIFALETFLLPEKGAENSKLLLTKAYKKRMLEAFAALLTKRRETHARDLESVKSAAPMEMAPPPVKIRPRLRVEPAPTYYLRMARSYDFLLDFLLTVLGDIELERLRGLTESGTRGGTLHEELISMRDLFYGLHIVSAEDIGMATSLRADEAVDRAACEERAIGWLKSWRDDPDLKVDTRVAVPIYYDLGRRRTRVWATLGVRLAKLDVEFARPPKIKPIAGGSDWVLPAPNQLEAAHYLIAVDEFAEVEIAGLAPLDRTELRAVCDAQKSKPQIIEALGQSKP